METQLIILGGILILFPLIIGTLFRTSDPGNNNPAFYWISGQIVLWAGFLVICVPLILSEQSFLLVCSLFNGYTAILLFLALLKYLLPFLAKKRSWNFHAFRPFTSGSKTSCALWIVFAVLLLVQLVLSVLLAYEEGDDAYYIAISTITQNSETMYQKLPYTGMTTTLDARHGLAPFPIWISYLSQTSGMPPVTVAQVVLAASMIALAYAIYYLIAKKLCDNAPVKTPFFMILTALLIMFGGYSLFTAENFLLVRASQGKAVVSGIIFPFLLYLFMLLLDKLQKNKRLTAGLWILITLSTTSACLCSTQGTILSCVFVGIFGLCAAVSYRKLSLLFWLATTCAVPIVMALLYFVVR